MPSSMLDSRKIEQRYQPYGQSSFSTAGQIMKFVIPNTQRTYLNGETGYLTGRLTLTCAAAVAGTDIYAILGTMYSLFSRQSVNCNGTVWDTVERPGELVNMLTQMTLNPSEKQGLSSTLGCAQNISVNMNVGPGAAYAQNAISSTIFSYNSSGNISYLFNGTANAGSNLTTTFAIPILGILNSSKMLPMFGGDITFELTVADITRWLVKIAGGTANTAVANFTFTIDNLELVYDSIELSPESNAMVMAAYPQKLIIKSQSYNFGSTAVGQGAGSYDLPINFKLASMKQLFFYFTQTLGTATVNGTANTPVGCADLTFGGVNPNGTDVVFVTNGKNYPMRPIKLSNPSECYMQVRKAFGSIYSNQFCGSIGRSEFLRRDAADAYHLAPVSTPGALQGIGNKYYLAIDTEIINTNKESLYNGIPTGINSVLRLNISSALYATTTCQFWACYDSLIEMDFTTGLTRTIF
jgi:hypothetical protein